MLPVRLVTMSMHLSRGVAHCLRRRTGSGRCSRRRSCGVAAGDHNGVGCGSFQSVLAARAERSVVARDPLETSCCAATAIVQVHCGASIVLAAAATAGHNRRTSLVHHLRSYGRAHCRRRRGRPRARRQV